MFKLPTRTAELQAYYVRKRELEHQRSQKSLAINRYYDHWDKVTSRYSNWTAPEYYQKNEEKIKNEKTTKEKKKDLTMRQERLKSLFSQEMSVYETQLKEIEKRKGNRNAQYATDILRRTEERLKEEENIKRKLEMEAKLYGKFRYGVEDEDLLFKSKNDHQVLAKLNWLDKQIEDQMKKEEEDKLAQERALKLKEATRRVEELQKDRQLSRQKEISDLRALQEDNMEKIQLHKNESELLRSREEELKFLIDEIEKEQQLLDESTAATAKPTDHDFRFNPKNIKVVIRQRSEEYRKHIQLLIDLLKRVSNYTDRPDEVKHLIQLYELDLENEALQVPQFEAMYESEAKHSFQRCEEIWQKQTLNRYREIKQLLDKEYSLLCKQLQQNLQKQNEIVEIRSKLLNSIETINDKSKKLLKECEDDANKELILPLPTNLEPDEDTLRKKNPEAPPSARTYKNFMDFSDCNDKMTEPRPSSHDYKNFLSFSDSNKEFLEPRSSRRRPISARDSEGDKFGLSKSFSNLNLVPSPSSAFARDLPRPPKGFSPSVVTSANAEKPQFGRRKIAWN